MGDRKARLAALAAKAGRTIKQPEVVASPPEEEEKEGTEDISTNKRHPEISFRNYAPNDNSLDQQKQHPEDDEGSPPKRFKAEEEGENDKQVGQGSNALQEALQEAKEEVVASSNNNIVDNNNNNNNNNEEITAMAPKKINWDLKRDIQDKIAKLERRTQKAIVELLKERLEKEASEQVSGDDDDDSDLD